MQHRRIIKEGPIVLATAEDGSMDPTALATHGLFLADTRFLSRFQLMFDRCPPVLLGSTEERLFEISYLFTNPPMESIPAHTVGILQRSRLQERSSGKADVHMELQTVNWSLKPVEFELTIEIGADFFDSFEARGVKRTKRGHFLPEKVSKKGIELGYEGLDGVKSFTSITSSVATDWVEHSCLRINVKLEPGERKLVQLDVAMRTEAPKSEMEQPEVSGKPRPDWWEHSSRINLSDPIMSSILERSLFDLEALMTEFPESWVPVAGLPRFAVPFGRDAIMTGLQTLFWNPKLSRDVLRFLAARQGKEDNPWNYEQPGKILHEMHTGELARLHEVPFGLFYGSVDSTPLFLVLAAEYLRWTHDVDFFHELQPHLDAAWAWIDNYGDMDGSGYIQYKAHTPPVASSGALTVGLFNQGWKDSSIAVVYSDGSIVKDHPIALAEVQGYLFRALSLWAEMFRRVPEGHKGPDGRPVDYKGRGEELLQRAERLKQKFNEDFWMKDKKCFAMALDGHHRHVDVITSNPGHCLWSRLVDDEHAEALAETLTSPPVLSSWGIRTMSNEEKAFNAFSYHDGSIWPFENALIMAGLKKYGFVKAAQDVHSAMVDASGYFEYRRWPEVYCGVTRETAGVLARQPDACRPQAWSAGAIFLMLQTWLGIATRPFSRHVDITPVLPTGLSELEVDCIGICDTTLSLRLVRENGHLLIEIRDNPGGLNVMIHPASQRERHLVGEEHPAQVR